MRALSNFDPLPKVVDRPDFHEEKAYIRPLSTGTLHDEKTVKAFAKKLKDEFKSPQEALFRDSLKTIVRLELKECSSQTQGVLKRIAQVALITLGIAGACLGGYFLGLAVFQLPYISILIAAVVLSILIPLGLEISLRSSQKKCASLSGKIQRLAKQAMEIKEESCEKIIETLRKENSELKAAIEVSDKKAKLWTSRIREQTLRIEQILGERNELRKQVWDLEVKQSLLEEENWKLKNAFAGEVLAESHNQEIENLKKELDRTTATIAAQRVELESVVKSLEEALNEPTLEEAQ